MERETLEVLSKLVRPQEAARQVFCAAVLDANRAGTLPVVLGEGDGATQAARDAVVATKTPGQQPPASAEPAIPAAEEVPLVPVINPSAAAEALGPKFAGMANIFGNQPKTVSGE
jgi:hypothetical protein